MTALGRLRSFDRVREAEGSLLVRRKNAFFGISRRLGRGGYRVCHVDRWSVGRRFGGWGLVAGWWLFRSRHASKRLRETSDPPAGSSPFSRRAPPTRRWLLLLMFESHPIRRCSSVVSARGSVREMGGRGGVAFLSPVFWRALRSRQRPGNVLTGIGLFVIWACPDPLIP